MLGVALEVSQHDPIAGIEWGPNIVAEVTELGHLPARVGVHGRPDPTAPRIAGPLPTEAASLLEQNRLEAFALEPAASGKPGRARSDDCDLDHDFLRQPCLLDRTERAS